MYSTVSESTDKTDSKQTPDRDTKPSHLADKQDTKQLQQKNAALQSQAVSQAKFARYEQVSYCSD